MSDPREHERRKVSLATHLFLRGERPPIIPCRIVDISQGGAQVHLNIRYRLPPRIFLLRDERENVCECEVAWQVAQAAGLKFVAIFAAARHPELLKEIEIAKLSMEV